MKKALCLVIICALIVAGCSVFESDHDATVYSKNRKNPKNRLFTYSSVSKDLNGIISEGPGIYSTDDDRNPGTLPKGAVEDLKTLPANMDYETAYNQLVYLFRRDYQLLEHRFSHFEPSIYVSDSRKKAKPRKEKLKVNIVVMVDSGKEMAKTIPGTNKKKMDLLKSQIKNSLKELKKDVPQGISYHVMFKTYGAILGKYTKLVPIEKVETELFPAIDEVIPGSVGLLSEDFKIVQEQLSKETAGNVLNQIFLITGSKDNFDYSAIRQAQEIFESDVQGQVHVMDYGVKDRKTRGYMQNIADVALGEYIVVNPKEKIPFDFKDQTDLNDDGYNPREYLLFKERAWTERIADLKENQIAEIDTLYGVEYEQLLTAVHHLKMKEDEKAKLLEEIEYRKKILANHYKREMDRLKIYFTYSKKRYGLEEK